MIPSFLIPAGIAAVSGGWLIAEGHYWEGGLLIAVALGLAEMRYEIFRRGRWRRR
jgi:hypothetical protein